jgi:hypothetical protein
LAVLDRNGEDMRFLDKMENMEDLARYQQYERHVNGKAAALYECARQAWGVSTTPLMINVLDSASSGRPSTLNLRTREKRYLFGGKMVGSPSFARLSI